MDLSSSVSLNSYVWQVPHKLRILFQLSLLIPPRSYGSPVTLINVLTICWILQHLSLTPGSKHQLQWDSGMGLLENAIHQAEQGRCRVIKKQTHHTGEQLNVGWLMLDQNSYSRRSKIMEFSL